MIAVIVSSQLGRLLHQHGDVSKIPHPEKYAALLTWLKKHHSKLQPTFPDIEEESMQAYFELHTDKEITEADLKTLRQLNGIDAAYKKPDEELPS